MESELLSALNVLKQPGVILTPTETVVGLSCSALSGDQISRIYQIKNRPSTKAFIVLVDSVSMIKKFVEEINELQKEYLNSKESTTVILSKIKGLPNNLIAEDNTLAFRITQHPELKKLITAFETPIVSTSANLSGNPSPKTLEEVDQVILDQVDYSLNLSSNHTVSSKPSRIVKILGDKVDIIRK
ncbi:MAG: translation factor Sua5 [Flavobacteriales bacterium]|nr:translation factor Sua5 [Flavobacteriales bacterium]